MTDETISLRPQKTFSNTGVHSNKYQKHLSVTNWKEFKHMGYGVYGCGLFVPFGKVIPKLCVMIKTINYLTPRFAGSIIAVKDIV